MDDARLVGLDVAQHDVRPAHEEPARIGNAFDGFEPRFHALHQTADGAGTVGADLVGGDDGRGFRHAIAFEKFDRVFVAQERARLVAQPFGAADGKPQRIQIALLAGARILRDERVGREQDRRARRAGCGCAISFGCSGVG